MMIENRFPIIYAECGYRHGDSSRVAKGIGVSRATISLMMNRQNYFPSLETALRAARFFGHPVEEIWRLKEESPEG